MYIESILSSYIIDIYIYAQLETDQLNSVSSSTPKSWSILKTSMSSIQATEGQRITTGDSPVTIVLATIRNLITIITTSGHVHGHGQMDPHHCGHHHHQCPHLVDCSPVAPSASSQPRINCFLWTTPASMHNTAQYCTILHNTALHLKYLYFVHCLIFAMED